MYRSAASVLALLLASACTTIPAQQVEPSAAPPASQQPTSADDPYIWLEEIQGERALAQVREWNAATEQTLAGTPQFEATRARAQAILEDNRQIAMPSAVIGDNVLNFWVDAENPRGLWRISPLASYAAGQPQWRTLIDVGALGRQEGQSWVWGGANCLAPDYRRCLVSLSPGGGDAGVVREFDVPSGAFVEGGFTLPEAKSDVSWLDADHLLVSTDFGEGSLTTSGYGRIAKVWRRGTPLSEASTIAEVEPTDTGVNFIGIQDDEQRWNIIQNWRTFWTSDYSLVVGNDALVPIAIPQDAIFRDIIDGRMIVSLVSDLAAGGSTYPAGAVVAYSLSEIASGRQAAPELVMAPTESQAIEEVSASDNVLWVKALDDVSGRLFALRRQPTGEWTRQAVDLPNNSTLQIRAVSGGTDTAFVTVEGMLTPPALYSVSPGAAPRLVQSLPPQFDASQFEVEQRFATSADGTRVPYFLVRRRGTSGPVPALIHAYGGFRSAQTPTYLTQQPYRAGPLGLFWAEEGNAYVLANIRGGGEYGPRWHSAALRENRQRSFDDLHAVAEHLIATGVSTPKRIAVSGRSNGGVLVGAAMNQRPDLYGAVISGSPLTDMRRYHQLLAGASWVGEYGNPDDPADWAFISRYSPYQNMRREADAPPVFYYSSTLDDRVHPGHARKMAARHEEYGQRFYFREYEEGGHSVGADRTEDAMRAALLLAFLKREIVQPEQ